MAKSRKVVIYPVIESETMQYRISDPDIFFDSSADDGVEWVNFTFEQLEVVLPDEVCDTSGSGAKNKFKSKTLRIPKRSISGGSKDEIDFDPSGTPDPTTHGTHSYTITGTETKLKVIGHSDPRIIIY